MLSTVVKGTRRSWARAPNIQVASARANKQQVRLEELCFQSGGLQRRAVPEEARRMGKGGGGGGGLRGVGRGGGDRDKGGKGVGGGDRVSLCGAGAAHAPSVRHRTRILSAGFCS